MNINDFYKNTTKKFKVIITYNGTTPNISSDVVSLVIKKEKGSSESTLTKSADVISEGTGGIANFTLTPTDTSIEHGKYFYEIIWTWSTGEIYIIKSDTVSILDRV